MTIKTELIKSYIADSICNGITDFEIDEEKIADTMAIRVLCEIQDILSRDELTDFEMIEEIVVVFGKYKLDFGGCHDFG